MPSSRRTPRRRKHPRADMESAPTDDDECRGQPGNRGPPLQQTSVGDDACTAPAGAFRRPTGPQARLLGRRSSREPRGGVRFPGRAMALPYKPRKTTGQTGTAVTTQASVGRDALIPPHPARRKRPRADMESAPTDDGECRGQPGNGAPAAPQTSVRDDACTAPAGAFRRPTGPQARLLGRRSSREPCGGVRFPGWDKSRPYKPSETTRQTGTGVTTRAFVGRDALIPPHPRGGANTRGRIWNPPLRTTANAAANRETAAPRYNKPL